MSERASNYSATTSENGEIVVGEDILPLFKDEDKEANRRRKCQEVVNCFPLAVE